MSRHIVILGGGVIGLSSALACLKRGHRVTVIERDPQRRGASLGNAGMVVPSHFVPLAAPGMVAMGLKWMLSPESPFYIKPRLDWDLITWGLKFWRASTKAHVERSAPLLRDLSLASRKLYADLAEKEEFGLVKKGLLMLCKTQHGLDEEAQTAKKARALGIPAEILDARATAELDPAVTMDIAGSVYFPQDCHLQPDRYVNTLLRLIRAAGGEVLDEVEVTGFRKSGKRVVAALTSTGDEIAGDEFVLASGAWSPGLVHDLGLRLSMQAGKGYSLTLPAPVELPQICAIFTEARVAATPMGSSLRIGGTMEIAGMNETVARRRIEGILKAVPQYYPRFRREHFEGVAPWYGFRPCPPDGLPYLGRTQAADNLVIATGHGMMGLSLAPVTGEVVGRLVDREPAGFDGFEMLSPDR
ncbi:FAD-dependent oxidoreductase [Verrucomicrobium sp. BvORR106]|uniref:NAD(P)/FAD-dependent oxidoreductase n=1 Tax=Verrucomicrobium sp. BvORR106 TaxID=1403819 RepID=UPI000571329F|nr:FAD-dependent oxidoreductase [Verrucomicrobium sp. BvORR106]